MANANIELYSPKGRVVVNLSSRFMKKLGTFDDTAYDNTGGFTDERMIGKKPWVIFLSVVKSGDNLQYKNGYGNYGFIYNYPSSLGFDSSIGRFSWGHVNYNSSGRPGIEYTAGDHQTSIAPVFCSSRWLYGYYE